ncbi:NAD(P)-binding domain-containing protein [Acidovorax sp. FG27]|uniref:NAD(P)-binding domain-containing protein n=1 Tax=Acidovorax sp. FG27 TaxID=3133652 RepID=UPI0030EAA878
MNIVIFGGGVVGQCYAEALAAQGHTIAGFVDPQPGAALRGLAQRLGAGVHAAPGAWLHAAQMAVSAVFGTVALQVARQAFAHLPPGALYVDMTTADPDDMRQAAREAEAGGHRFVDVAITGAVNLSGARTPVLCSGTAAPEVAALLGACGAPVRTVGARPGDAAALKLLRSIFTKGMEALAVECLVTAEQQGLRAELHDVLLDIDQGSLRETMESMVRTHIPHAGRRRNEVVEAQRQMRLAGVEPIVLPGVQQLFEHTVQGQVDAPYAGSSTADALAWLATLARTPPAGRA